MVASVSTNTEEMMYQRCMDVCFKMLQMCEYEQSGSLAMCTFEGRALTWWNGNVQTLGLANANQIPWSNVKAMMTTEYCPQQSDNPMDYCNIELWDSDL
ncbi:hypothetical protein Tco_0210338 [Tanacetum coccineum]